MTEQLRTGQRFHHAGRKHPTKEGWLQANGEIIDIIMSSDDPDDDLEPYEVIVLFDGEDTETYFFEELEWVPDLGGYWQVA